MANKYNFISGFIAGVASCAVVWLYFQTDDGQKTVSKVKDTLKQTGSKILSSLDEMDDLMQYVVEQGKSFIREEKTTSS